MHRSLYLLSFILFSLFTFQIHGLFHHDDDSHHGPSHCYACSISAHTSVTDVDSLLPILKIAILCSLIFYSIKERLTPLVSSSPTQARAPPLIS